MIDFSIIIPTYNLEKYIVTTLESICKNKLENTEIIIVDDGSTDNTKEVAREYLNRKNVPQFQILSQENKGVSAARNVGIAEALGKYLIFCDGDDLCADNLMQTIDAYKNKDYDMLVWRYYIKQENVQKESQNAFARTTLYSKEALKSFLLEGNRVRIGSFAVKKALLEDNNISFTEGCAIAEDVEFMYKCLTACKSVFLLNDLLFTYVKRAGSAMNAFDWKRFQAPIAMRRVYEYAASSTCISEDAELVDYLYNGLYILHCMFSFDGCIQYIKGFKEANVFFKKYLQEYPQIETEIKLAIKTMQVKPQVFSKKRLLLFGLSRRLYIYYYVLTAKR